ncbi:MAG TPA: hypothetical protein VGK50_01575 [Coriobacteriia bacterium]
MAGLSATIIALVVAAAAGVLAPLTIGRVADAGHRPVRPIALRPVVAAPTTVAVRSAEHPAAPSAVHGSAARTTLASAAAPHSRGGRSTASPVASPIAFRPGVTAPSSTAAPTAPVALPIASTLVPAADKATDDDAGVSASKPHKPKPEKPSRKKPKTAHSSSRPQETQPLRGKSGK